MIDTNPEELELIQPTDQILNLVAQEVSTEEVGSNFVQGVIDRMLELSAGKGHSEHDSRQMVGLAVVQLGVSKRIVTIDVTADGSKKPQNLQVLINPRIVSRSKQLVPGREGCWSCGNICGNVERSRSVKVDAIDRNGEAVSLSFDGFVARIVQHEIDHLDGIRFPDRIPLDEPGRLHWVEPTQFDDYRTNWANWPNLCPRERWEEMKAGTTERHEFNRSGA